MKPILLMWTSGWDSTFRLLQIILIEKKTVQPIYIIDRKRKSLQHELKALENIQAKIKELFPTNAALILPIRFEEKDSLVKNDEILTGYNKFNSRVKIGSQYIWLAEFCKMYDLKDVEMSFDKDSSLNSFGNIFEKNYSTISRSEATDLELYDTIDTVFKYFKFPIFHLSKSETLQIVKENNWYEIMKLTWFCHNPKKNQPCGKCNPCKNTRKDGLGFRIPLINRMKGQVKILKNRIKSIFN